MGVELNGLVHFLFPSFNSIDCNPHEFCSDAYPKKKRALIVNLSLCVSLCACMHRTLYI